MSRITVLGLGAMGSRMAANLIKAGHSVTVWNRTPAAAAPLIAQGALLETTPRSAATAADIVIAMLRDDRASRSVWLDPETGALGSMPAGSLAIESSTLTVAWVKELAREVAARGGAFLDAPVAGSRPQAAAGQLIYMVGGNGDDFRRAEPVLKTMGVAAHHAGPTGSGAAVKLAVNALLAVQVAALGELAGLLKASGMNLVRAVDIIGATPVASAALKGAAASMLAAQFAPMFPIELVEKDLDYTLGQAEQAGVALPMTTAARQIMAAATAAGLGGDHLTAIARLFDPTETKNIADPLVTQPGASA